MNREKKRSNLFFKESLNISLSKDEVMRILGIYHPGYRFINNARINDLKLICIVKATTYPYTVQEVFQYITAPTAALLASQLSYVLIGGLVIHKHPSLLDCFRDFKEFCSARDNASLKFGRLDIKFRSQIPIGSSVKGVIDLKELRVFNKRLHGIMNFKIGDGISGNIHAMIDEEYREPCTEIRYQS